ncbi:MAG: hypothetical protein HQM12_21370, partial [SAR324 cluster bacterium]|nr:hypothetical protein [SAR324 cluster bacterium]
DIRYERQWHFIRCLQVALFWGDEWETLKIDSRDWLKVQEMEEQETFEKCLSELRTIRQSMVDLFKI